MAIKLTATREGKTASFQTVRGAMGAIGGTIDY
jgi:hypothetical protein